jgi:hypothetical protein
VEIHGRARRIVNRFEVLKAGPAPGGRRRGMMGEGEVSSLCYGDSPEAV